MNKTEKLPNIKPVIATVSYGLQKMNYQHVDSEQTRDTSVESVVIA